MPSRVHWLDPSTGRGERDCVTNKQNEQARPPPLKPISEADTVPSWAVHGRTLRCSQSTQRRSPQRQQCNGAIGENTVNGEMETANSISPEVGQLREPPGGHAGSCCFAPNSCSSWFQPRAGVCRGEGGRKLGGDGERGGEEEGWDKKKSVSEWTANDVTYYLR